MPLVIENMWINRDLKEYNLLEGSYTLELFIFSPSNCTWRNLSTDVLKQGAVIYIKVYCNIFLGCNNNKKAIVNEQLNKI